MKEYIVWIGSNMYYLCEGKKELQEKLELIGERYRKQAKIFERIPKQIEDNNNFSVIKKLRKELQQTTDAFEAYRNFQVENADERIKSARELLKLIGKE